MFEKRMKEIRERKAEIRGVLETAKDNELDLIQEELRALDNEQRSLEKRAATAEGINNGTIIGNPIKMPGGLTMGEMRNKEAYEQRGQDLKDRRTVYYDMVSELRSVTIASSNLVLPTQTSNTLNQAFNQVSSIVDLVKAVPVIGGKGYKQGFVTGYGEGDYTTEGEDYHDADPIMDYVDIPQVKITAYCEISEDAVKLSNVNYQAEIANNMNIAIRKKLGKQILLGAGGTSALTGIFNAPANVMPTSGDLSINAINANTLDEIVFGYGGDEDVEGDCYLILNKKDLAAFADVRTSVGEKLYKITLNGNTGTISSSESYSVPFILNSGCPQLSAAGTAADTYCMAYGKLLAYELPIFSQLEVTESRDFKFKEGMICYKGAVWCGGNTTMYKGFTRIKKTN